MVWIPSEDCVSLKPVTIGDMIQTKRNILKVVAAHFDPMGLFAPVLLKGKCLIQRLWSKGLDWDTEIPLELENEWNEIKGDLENISNVKIPRCVTFGSDKTVNKYSLVCFVMLRKRHIPQQFTCVKQEAK